MITFIGTAKLIGTLFELLLDDCFSHEFFVELEIEFNIEGGPFGSEAAHKWVVDYVGRVAYFWFEGLWNLLVFISLMVGILRHIIDYGNYLYNWKKG